MEQKAVNSKLMSYRMRPEIREFVDRNAAKTYRSAQGMMDYLMNRLMEMERKGEITIE
ncbi:TPA: hypothetical protein SMI33_002694 [Serratia marcescens]|uniref:Uncharacterized protein n=1 Tax=Serratia marcescens TaxID=615 RepID=A0AA46K6S0_SERMA|nr:hypothetical protein [Serratia marcescens]TQI85641.1 hypothetical protein FHU12_3210 [Serratia marcescens]HEJ7117339.1 hypothetical protein [Serratia marcescens]HEJ8008011.1 hypothetical protein [Serratia marcescens]